MLSCEEAARYLLYAADDATLLDHASRAALNDHMSHCGECRRELEDQAAVAALLRTRPPDVPSLEFSAALRAHLDAASGWLSLADWRRWTVRLLPGTCILVLAAFVAPSHTSVRQGSALRGAPTISGSAASEAILWDFGAPPDAVVEAMLTGPQPQGTGQ
jgi:hypothetical protein